MIQYFLRQISLKPTQKRPVGIAKYKSVLAVIKRENILNDRDKKREFKEKIKKWFSKWEKMKIVIKPEYDKEKITWTIPDNLLIKLNKPKFLK